MAQQTTLVQEGTDRINDALRSIDEEFQKLQKEFAGRRKSITKEWSKQRKSFEKQARKEVTKFQRELKKNPIVKKGEEIRKDAVKQVETNVENLLGVFQIASKSDLSRIDRKLNTIGRRLKEIEKGKASATSAK